MFFVDKPYISDLFKKTVRDHAIPVVGTDTAQASSLYPGTTIISEDRAIAMARESGEIPIYTISENSIGWIAKHLAFSVLPEKIDLFKNKLKFRELTRPLFPDFFFKGVRSEELRAVRFDEIPLPFIIKPAVGFFSMGVHKVSSHTEWNRTVDSLTAETDRLRGIYPEEVFNAGSFIIEQCIEGEEYAVDAFFTATGEPVIAGIFKHVFSSDADVSDRVYLSSKKIIESNLEEFTGFIGSIGTLAGVKTFPMHIELRRNAAGALLPIEVNPMRFGGWCSTPDMTTLAYGVNPYVCYYTQKKPDWPAALRGKEGKLFSLIVLDNPTGISGDRISSFDYEKLLTRFEKPVELRRIDYTKYPVFGFLFTETGEDNFGELENILVSDLSEFITISA